MNRSSSTVSLFAALSALLMLLSSAASAVTLADLQQDDKLRIKTWIEPAQDIVARQQLKLQIEVATDKWFSGGTTIGHFEIKDAIVLKREQFALNSTLTEGDKTWTVQQWTVVVYPQRSGLFEVPAIPLKLTVADDSLDAKTSQIETLPLEFIATLPAAIPDTQGWIATTRFEVSERFNKPMEDLKPGDAVTRTIRMSADDLPAMMLPKVQTDEIAGIAIYAKPPELADKVNRGNYLAERIQKITYVFENSGEYELPAKTFHWWNLEAGSVEVITLPAITLVVAALPGLTTDPAPAIGPGFSDNLRSMPMANYQTLMIGVLLLVGLWFARRYVSSFTAKKSITQALPTQAWLLKQARLACQKNNNEKAISYLYQWIDHFGSTPSDALSMQVAHLDNPELKLVYDATMQAIYSKDKSHSPDTCRLIDQLITAIKAQDKSRHWFQWSVEMKLN